MRLLHALPNLLTGSRLLLALPLALAILDGHFTTALLIAAIAGLTDALAAACDVNVKIPMRGRADSLNLAVATGIMAYAATEDR